MKINIKFPLILMILIIFLSCNSEESVEESHLNAKQLVENNEFLSPEVDFNNPQAFELLSNSEKEEMKAIFYRFYSNVQVVNNNYITTLKSGSDINVSEDIFNMLNKNLTEINQGYDKLKSEGKSVVEKREVEAEYLESLLQ